MQFTKPKAAENNGNRRFKRMTKWAMILHYSPVPSHKLLKRAKAFGPDSLMPTVTICLNICLKLHFIPSHTRVHRKIVFPSPEMN